MRRLPMTSVVSLIAGALLSVVGEANAATIYGTVFRNNQPFVRAQITLDCGGNPTTATDERGSYHLSANHIGQCNITIGGASGVVVFYQQPTRYDFNVVGTKLIRR